MNLYTHLIPRFQVSMENFFFWLKAVSRFQLAESILMETASSVAKLQELLSQAIGFYQDGLASLKTAVTTDHPMFFQFKVFCVLLRVGNP